MYKKFSISRTVEFCDVDLGGGLYHPNYYKYLDSARVQALASVGMPFKEFFRIGTALVVVSIESKFTLPAFFEDNLIIETEIIEVGRTSLSLRQQIFSRGFSHGETSLKSIHTSIIVLAHVCLEKKKATPLPDQLIERLKI